MHYTHLNFSIQMKETKQMALQFMGVTSPAAYSANPLTDSDHAWSTPENDSQD